jgi:hypothetical protein
MRADSPWSEKSELEAAAIIRFSGVHHRDCWCNDKVSAGILSPLDTAATLALLIFDRLLQLSTGRTMTVITHRPAVLLRMDAVFAFSGGRLLTSEALP